jgi:hypothetical protein
MWLRGKRAAEDRQDASVPDAIKKHPAWGRLADQLNWYDSKSRSNQYWYKRLKVLQVVLAVAIPIASHAQPEIAKWLTSIAGALIALLEGIQHLNQHAMLWVMYRSTAERLKHEKYLFLSAAGPYKDLNDTDRLITLAERVEEHVSSEHANWMNETQHAASKKQERH